MLKIKILAALIILTANKGNCQNKAYDGKTEIHKSVVKAFRKEGVRFSVLGSTKKSVFSNFDFGGGGRGLDSTTNRIWNKKEWVGFVKGIDTASITDYSLDINTAQNGAKKRIDFCPDHLF